MQNETPARSVLKLVSIFSFSKLASTLSIRDVLSTLQYFHHNRTMYVRTNACVSKKKRVSPILRGQTILSNRYNNISGNENAMLEIRLLHVFNMQVAENLILKFSDTVYMPVCVRVRESGFAYILVCYMAAFGPPCN